MPQQRQRSTPPGYKRVNGQLVPGDDRQYAPTRLSANERAAGRIDEQAPGYPGTALARSDSSQIGILPENIKTGPAGNAMERAMFRLSKANDPNIPDEQKPYLPGSMMARTDSIAVKLPLGTEQAEKTRKGKANLAKERRTQRNADRTYVTGLRKEIRSIRTAMAKTEKTADREIVRVNPPGSEGYKELKDQLDSVKAELKEFNEQKKGGKLKGGKTPETAVDFDGTDAAFKKLPVGTWFFPPDGGSPRQKIRIIRGSDTPQPSPRPARPNIPVTQNDIPPTDVNISPVAPQNIGNFTVPPLPPRKPGRPNIPIEVENVPPVNEPYSFATHPRVKDFKVPSLSEVDIKLVQSNKPMDNKKLAAFKRVYKKEIGKEVDLLNVPSPPSNWNYELSAIYFRARRQEIRNTAESFNKELAIFAKSGRKNIKNNIDEVARRYYELINIIDLNDIKVPSKIRDQIDLRDPWYNQ